MIDVKTEGIYKQNSQNLNDAWALHQSPTHHLRLSSQSAWTTGLYAIYKGRNCTHYTRLIKYHHNSQNKPCIQLDANLLNLGTYKSVSWVNLNYSCIIS